MKQKKEWIMGVSGGVLTFFGMNLAAFFLMFPNPKQRWEQDRYDCAVVCGYHAREDGRPTEVMKRRVEKAAELWRERRVGYLVMSGAAVANDWVEAEVMKQYAMELGVPEQYIVEEKRADCTFRNLRYSAEVMKNCGFQDCAVVTSGWHLRKADHYARREGLRYVMVRAEEPEGQSVWKTLRLHLETNLHMYRNMWKGYY